jgi:hypothetical protein
VQIRVFLFSQYQKLGNFFPAKNSQNKSNLNYVKPPKIPKLSFKNEKKLIKKITIGAKILKF